jgi:hypothetical protein
MGVKLGLREFQNRVMISGPMTDEVTGEWRRLHNDELYDLYSSNIIGSIKSRKRWAGHLARMADRTGFIVFCWGDLMKSDHMEDRALEARIILKWIYK